jgi:cysteine desulfurase
MPAIMMRPSRVYLDYNATSPIHPAVRQTLIDSFDLFGNPSSVHSFGREAASLVEKARESVARLIGAEVGSIVFTGGGSESNNTILRMPLCGDTSCRRFCEHRRGLVTSAIEHPSVLYTAHTLAESGVPVTFVGVDETGKIRLDELDEALTDQVALVSIMMANNEIGTIQDIAAVTEIAHRRGILVHTDAVQAVGKIPVDVGDLGVDFLSLSGHKFGAPKGVGALYVRQDAPFCTLIYGGHQEAGRRAGTLNTQGIVGIGAAADLFLAEADSQRTRIGRLRKRLLEGIARAVPDIRVNGHPTDVLPGTLNVSFRGAEGEAILLYLDLAGIAVSTGSACASGSLDPSHVLLATGVGAELAHGSIRFGIGFLTTEEEIDYVIAEVPPVIERLRKMSTVYVSARSGA